MKIFIYYILCTSLLTCNGLICTQKNNDYSEKYKITILKEKYHKEIKEVAFKLNSTNFLKLKNIKNEKNNNVDYLGLFAISKANNYNEEELPTKISELESYESPSFLLFENKKFENRIFMWKIEGEYFSNIFIYSINTTIDFLGEITIGKFCEPNCDTFNLTERDILVKGNKTSIEIIFKGRTFYNTPKIIQSDKGGRIIAENLTLSYFFNNNEQ